MLMCPHCGLIYDPQEVPWNLLSAEKLVPEHFASAGPPERCPGSWQNPRNPESDRRRLWNGEENRYLPRQAVDAALAEQTQKKEVGS